MKQLPDLYDIGDVIHSSGQADIYSVQHRQTGANSVLKLYKASGFCHLLKQ